jgi:hypothetical protein
MRLEACKCRAELRAPGGAKRGARARLLQLLQLRTRALLHQHVQLLAQPLLRALLLAQRLIRGLKHLRICDAKLGDPACPSGPPTCADTL